MNIIPYTRIRPIENLVTTAVITKEMVARGPSNIFELFVEQYAGEHIKLIKARAFFEPRLHELSFERWDDPLRNQTKVAFRWLLKNAAGDRVILVGGPAEDGKVLAVPYRTQKVLVASFSKEHRYEYAGYAVEEYARAFTYRRQQ